MDFARPLALLLIGLVPLLMMLSARDKRRRAAAWAAIGRSGRVPSSHPIRGIAVVVALIVALAGPRIGRVPGSELPPGRDVILLVDTSRSMAAEDSVPNRLGAAVSAAEGLTLQLGRDPGDRVGVIAFAGGAEPRCPLTDRVAAAIDVLKDLRPGDVQPGGTDLGSALLAALDAFDDQEPRDGRAIVVLTDGEDLSGAWMPVLDRLRASKVVVHGVTFGDSAEGHIVPVGEARDALKYEGETVLSRRADAALSAICTATGGVLVPVGQARADLGSLYRDSIAPLERSRRQATSVPERADRSSWFVAGALGLIGSAAWPKSRRANVLIVFLAIGIGAGPTFRSLSEAMNAGESLYRQGDFAGALAAFESAASHGSTSPLPRYNLAATLFNLGRYDEAERAYLEARKTADEPLRAKIDYALGNVAVATGRYKESLDRYDACLASTAFGETIARLKADARANRTFAETRIPPQSSPDPEGNRRTNGSGEDQEPEKPKGSGETPPRDRDTPPSPQPKGDGPKPPPDPSNTAPPPNSTPEKRLDAMLDEVRKGQRSVGDGAAPQGRANTDRKDW